MEHRQSLDEFFENIENEKRRKDSIAIVNLMAEATGEEPVVWEPNVVGFGRYHYKYESGREGVSPLTTFSPRKQSLTIYIFPGLDRYKSLLANLGKYRTGKVCLYINKLDDVDIPTLQELVKRSAKLMARAYR